ncbi:MarR family winged helix-turn-helix transcriptional regulator [Mycobacterium cookii]
MGADLRAMTAGSDRLGRHFARQHHLHNSDLRALLHIMVAETAGEPLNSSQLRERMDISNAAITYLVDRVMSAGHIRRETDPSDRRKSLLRMEDGARVLGREFFGPLGAHLHSAVAELSDDELLATHRVLMAMNDAMSAFEDELQTASGRSAQDARSDNGHSTEGR